MFSSSDLSVALALMPAASNHDWRCLSSFGRQNRPRPQYPKLRQVLCLQQHKVLLTSGPSLRMNAGPRRALPGSPGFGSQKAAHSTQKPLLRSTAVSSQSLHFCPGKFGGAAQHMIRRNSKLLSALMIVTQWVFFAAESGRPAIAGKREARTSWWRGLLGFFYYSRVSIPGYG